jgi:hypothetical protein
MKSEDKKAAIADYRKRKSAAGIFAVRCATSNQVWVGQTLNLDTVQNRIWFTLRVGTHSARDLQSAWTSHGADTSPSSRSSNSKTRRSRMSATRS